MIKATFNKWDGKAWEGPYKGSLECPKCHQPNEFYCDPGENRIQNCSLCKQPLVQFEWKSNPLKAKSLSGEDV